MTTSTQTATTGWAAYHRRATALNDVIADLPPESRRQLIEMGRKRLLGDAAATLGGDQASLLSDQSPELGTTARRALETLHVDASTHLDDLLEKVEDTSPSELIAALFDRVIRVSYKPAA